jgi:hypothetical protein
MMNSMSCLPSSRHRLSRYFAGLVLLVLLGSLGVADAAPIALWTFESPNIPADSVGITSGPWSPAIGSGEATGFHTVVTSTWSTPVGNGSAESWNSNNWSVGDYYQFKVATTGVSGIGISFDQTRSGTGPSGFDLQYSVGTSGSFTTFQSYIVPQVSWSSSTPVEPPSTTFSFDLSSITALDNQPEVFFRMTATSAPGSGGGTNRIDNVSVVPEPATWILAGCGVLALGGIARRRKT